jgi:polar amino acid transport system permease protein
VPLILLVYLVFYGVPSVGGFSYVPTLSFVITLSVYSGAYLVEVFRAGFDAVPRGLIDAGKAIGLTPWQRLVHVRLPTMFRIVLPSLSNTYISLFKDTSIASVIAVPELTYAAQWINFNTFRIIEVYAVVAPMYLVTGYAILLSLQQLERRFVVRRESHVGRDRFASVPLARPSGDPRGLVPGGRDLPGDRPGHGGRHHLWTALDRLADPGV